MKYFDHTNFMIKILVMDGFNHLMGCSLISTIDLTIENFKILPKNIWSLPKKISITFCHYKIMVTKSCFNCHKIFGDQMMQFLVTFNFLSSNPTSFWPRLILGWSKLTLYWCDVGLHLHANVFIMSWQMHGHGDNIICRMVGGKNEVGS